MDTRVRAAIDFMHDNLSGKLTPSEVADVVHLSVSRVRQLFRTETGMTFGRYLRDLRMEHAKELLETTFLSVKEVGSRVGVKSNSHFVRQFQKAYHTTPARYAVRYRRAASRS
jgi:transcriptional regulator GlxA family with amidase domain